VIQATQIHKTFGTLEVLKGIDVDFQRGQLTSIVGTSGAGKTTLLHILGTLLRPSEGSLIIDGMEVSKMNESQLSDFRNKNIGFVFQFHHLLPEFTALENVCLPAFIAGVSRKKAETRAKELLDYLNLTERLTHKPAELSGGEQQRVAVARALMNNPSLILADEPSGNLDTQHKKELHDLFFKLRDEFNPAIVIVTHDMSLAEMSDRTLTMKDGKIVN
jgi:lipoprotein-releasing system ATP-binding protein